MCGTLAKQKRIYVNDTDEICSVEWERYTENFAVEDTNTGDEGWFIDSKKENRKLRIMSIFHLVDDN